MQGRGEPEVCGNCRAGGEKALPGRMMPAVAAVTAPAITRHRLVKNVDTTHLLQGSRQVIRDS